MPDLLTLAHHHPGATLECVGVLLLTTATFSGLWLRQGLREGVTWLGAWWRPSRAEMPELYWTAIVGHACMTVFLAMGGAAILVWGLAVQVRFVAAP